MSAFLWRADKVLTGGKSHGKSFKHHKCSKVYREKKAEKPKGSGLLLDYLSHYLFMAFAERMVPKTVHEEEMAVSLLSAVHTTGSIFISMKL